jgi:hypothetical protein
MPLVVYQAQTYRLCNVVIGMEQKHKETNKNKPISSKGIELQPMGVSDVPALSFVSWW